MSEQFLLNLNSHLRHETKYGVFTAKQFIQQCYQPWKKVLWFICISLCLCIYFFALLLQYYLILFYINQFRQHRGSLPFNRVLVIKTTIVFGNPQVFLLHANNRKHDTTLETDSDEQAPQTLQNFGYALNYKPSVQSTRTKPRAMFYMVSLGLFQLYQE